MPDTKIVHIIGNLDHGGAERFVTDLCNELARKDADITLVSLCANDLEHSFLDQLSDKVKYVCFAKKNGLSISVILKLTAWLMEQRPAVVHSHLNSSEYLLLYRIWSKKTVFYHTIHNIAEAECPERALKVLRQLFYSMNKVVPVTISARCRESYRRYYRLKNDQLIENARPALYATSSRDDLAIKYSKYADEILLVHIGRISIEKNQHLLIETVQELNRTEARKCRLLLIGEIKDQKLYAELQVAAAGDAHIEFLGLRKNIADYLSIADAFCLSSDWEGMPISLIEAMSVGCIPVCTAVGGITDMITDGYNGFLSPPKDVPAYGNALKKVIYGHNLEQVRVQTISTYFQRYTIGISADNHLKMYNEAVEATYD